MFFVFMVGGAGTAAAKYAAFVMDARTGEVLHEAHADSRYYPASITKVMTLFLVFDALKAGKLTMDTPIKVSARAAGQAPSRLGLEAGGRVTVRDVVLGLITKSANDAATAIGEHLGGTERKFAEMMNEKAEAIGLANTHFRNASGLPHRQQLTTARDLAKMVQALQRAHPQYYKLFSTRSFTYDGRKHDNHNRLLDRYEGTDGVKTGYIRASGYNLAVSATRAGHRLIAVVMGTNSIEARDLHMMGLLERGFEKATGGRYVAYHYDRNINPAGPQAAAKKTVARARGAKGQIRLARLTPPRRPAEIARAARAVPLPTEIARASGAVPAPADAAAESEGGTDEGDQASASDTVTRALDDGPMNTPASQIPAAPEPQPLNWEIQVGAFSRQAPAHLTATRAMRRLPGLLAHTRINIVATREDGRSIYRARLAGLDAARAERACELLIARKMECRTVPPDGHAAALSPAAPKP